MADAAAAFHFPDDALGPRHLRPVITARDQPDRLEAFVTALVPVYFGRVGELRHREPRPFTTERAEESVERQAREFERLKPYLVDRWNRK